jgi:uncharacterized membrane protein SirB2
MSAFTLAHVVISLVGIGSGLAVVAGLLAAKRLDAMTALFLASTALTSITGFGFPFDHLLPSHVVGLLSLIVLTIAVYARYARRLEGRWRSVYVGTAVTALYFNVFVLIVQAFLKVPALNAAAPTQSEPPFLVAQLIALVIFAALGVMATLRFRNEPSSRRARMTV